MPNREWKFRIEDILDAIVDITNLVENLAYEDFCTKTTTVKAVLYEMAVIGEAARRVPLEISTLYPEIPWREMSDIRNVVIHEYFGIDLQIIWETIHHDLVPLEPLLRRMLSESRD